MMYDENVECEYCKQIINEKEFYGKMILKNEVLYYGKTILKDEALYFCSGICWTNGCLSQIQKMIEQATS